MTTLRLFTAWGAAAGLASVYHTPLAGAMFVAEVVLGSITVERLIPLFASAVAATFTIHLLGAQGAPFALVHAAPRTKRRCALRWRSVRIARSTSRKKEIGRAHV